MAQPKLSIGQAFVIALSFAITERINNEPHSIGKTSLAV